MHCAASVGPRFFKRTVDHEALVRFAIPSCSKYCSKQQCLKMLWLLFLLMVGVLGTNSSNESNETNQSMSEFNCSSADFPPCHHCNSCEEAMECAPVACLAEGAPALLECMYSEERRWYLVCTSHISKGHAMVTGPILWCLAWWSSA